MSKTTNEKIKKSEKNFVDLNFMNQDLDNLSTSDMKAYIKALHRHIIDTLHKQKSEDRPHTTPELTTPELNNISSTNIMYDFKDNMPKTLDEIDEELIPFMLGNLKHKMMGGNVNKKLHYIEVNKLLHDYDLSLKEDKYMFDFLVSLNKIYNNKDNSTTYELNIDLGNLFKENFECENINKFLKHFYRDYFETKSLLLCKNYILYDEIVFEEIDLLSLEQIDGHLNAINTELFKRKVDNNYAVEDWLFRHNFKNTDIEIRIEVLVPQYKFIF